MSGYSKELMLVLKAIETHLSVLASTVRQDSSGARYIPSNQHNYGSRVCYETEYMEKRNENNPNHSDSNG